MELDGRYAICAYSDKQGGGRGKYFRKGMHDPVPSSVDLPFFEYLGEGSDRAMKTCKHCGYYEVAHTEATHKEALVKQGRLCTNFEPHGPWEKDTYYCGCWGWD